MGPSVTMMQHTMAMTPNIASTEITGMNCTSKEPIRTLVIAKIHTMHRPGMGMQCMQTSEREPCSKHALTATRAATFHQEPSSTASLPGNMHLETSSQTSYLVAPADTESSGLPTRALLPQQPQVQSKCVHLIA